MKIEQINRLSLRGALKEIESIEKKLSNASNSSNTRSGGIPPHP